MVPDVCLLARGGNFWDDFRGRRYKKGSPEMDKTPENQVTAAGGRELAEALYLVMGQLGLYLPGVTMGP